MAREINITEEQKTNAEKQIMEEIKNYDRRNWLAHGNQSFNECSRDTTIGELKIIKNESIDYMRFILTHIQKFISNKQYLLS